jgi:ureidoacrylate peracid hydrolase
MKDEPARRTTTMKSMLSNAIAPDVTGLLIVDMQNGFCDPDGELGRRGQGDPLQAIVPSVGTLAKLCRRAQIPVFWSTQEHDPADITRTTHRVQTHIAKSDYLPCLRGTWDAEIVDALKELVEDDDYVFPKHRASCFYNTTLEVALRMRGISTLMIAGVTTNYCVDSTIRDAYARDFDLVVVRDCVAARDHALHEATLRNVELFHGLVCSLDDISSTLFEAAAPAAS